MFKLCWQTAKIRCSGMFFEIKSLFGTTKSMLGLCFPIQLPVFLWSALIAAVVNMKQRFSVPFFLWFASGCCDFGWAWKETCRVVNVLSCKSPSFLDWDGSNPFDWLSLIFTLTKCSQRSSSCHLLILSYWKLIPLSQEGAAIWGFPASSRMVLLISMSCLLNFDLGERNDKPEVNRLVSVLGAEFRARKGQGWEIFRQWPKPAAWEGKW